MELIIKILIGLVCLSVLIYCGINLPKEISKYPLYYLFYKYQMIVIPIIFGTTTLLLNLAGYQVMTGFNIIAITFIIIGVFLWLFMDKLKAYELMKQELNSLDKQIIIDTIPEINWEPKSNEKTILFILGIYMDLGFIYIIWKILA